MPRLKTLSQISSCLFGRPNRRTRIRSCRTPVLEANEALIMRTNRCEPETYPAATTGRFWPKSWRSVGIRSIATMMASSMRVSFANCLRGVRRCSPRQTSSTSCSIAWQGVERRLSQGSSSWSTWCPSVAPSPVTRRSPSSTGRAASAPTRGTSCPTGAAARARRTSKHPIQEPLLAMWPRWAAPVIRWTRCEDWKGTHLACRTSSALCSSAALCSGGA
mmetsp:Transcript_100778/g.308116  ORF Transcript_100778/g.308116 Transcript_100778/m.308116 type:complete len:219 (+) Transcript_100778:1155-1811(+)